MPELLLELLSEEIPAGMQEAAARELAARVQPLLGDAKAEPFWGTRRIGLVARDVAASIPGSSREERGPRVGAPERALDGFAQKHGVGRGALVEEGGYWLLRLETAESRMADRLAEALPGLIRRLPWPKSMRWGLSPFTWVRPLRRILCLLDGAVVPFALAEGDDDAHGLASSDQTEGHRVHAPAAFTVTGFEQYRAELQKRFVVLEAAEREKIIAEGIAALAKAEGVEVVPDAGLLREVAGLVEWPVPLLGRIDDAFMDLPPEVMRTTMRVNQRYFALRKPDGGAAPCFALVANITSTDAGAAITAGNERVLRARLSDARFFWDQDRKQRLQDFLPKLDRVVFHAKLGTQGERVRRLEKLAGLLAPQIGANMQLAVRAAMLAKADLATGMVGEFPELQGVMGRYYAQHAGEDPRVAEAVGAHYRPLGPTDEVPKEPVAIAVALADKLDQLAGFFSVGEKPTGSGDPFALRRAALGVLRIIRENGLRINLSEMLEAAAAATKLDIVHAKNEAQIGAILDEAARKGVQLRGASGDAFSVPQDSVVAGEVLEFLADRLRVQLRGEGARHDVLAAIFSAGADDDVVRLLAKTDAVTRFLGTEDGRDLLAGHRRAANILRIEEKKDGVSFAPAYQPELLRDAAEKALAEALEAATPKIDAALEAEEFDSAMDALAQLRGPVDAFFTNVMVNDSDAMLRRNRLGLLARLRATMDRVAAFHRIET